MRNPPRTPQVAATLSGNVVGKDAAALVPLRSALAACATQGMGLNPDQHGSVTVELGIAANGTVSAATAKPSEAFSSDVTGCMAKEMKRGIFEATGTARTLSAHVVVKPSP